MRWAVGQEAGWAWRVRLPRQTTSLSVLPGTDIAPIDAFPLPSSPAWAAINGGFYDDGPMGLVVADGREHAPLRPDGGSGVLVAGDAGVRILHARQWPQPGTHALQSIDRLVVDGTSVVSPDADATRAARSAVALTATDVWFVATAADASISRLGSGTWSLDKVYGNGMTLHEFSARLAADLQVMDALDLDGGLSTQLVVEVPGERVVLRGVSGTIDVLVAVPPSHRP